MENNKPAVGYVRVSSREQAKEGLSLADQRTKIEAYCNVYSFDLIRVCADEGKSAKKAENRPALQEALDLVCREKAVLVICKLDRMVRSTIDAIDIAMRLNKCGADLASLSEHIDTSSANGKFVYRLFASLAEMERELTAERTKDTLDEKRVRMEKLGNAPYGFKAVPEKKVKGGPVPMLVPCDIETATLFEILKMRFLYKNYEEIARHLNDTGVTTRCGGHWNRGGVRKIVMYYNHTTHGAELLKSLDFDVVYALGEEAAH